MTALRSPCLKISAHGARLFARERSAYSVCGQKGVRETKVDSTASKTEALEISGRAKERGDDFLIVYISYNARYAWKYRGVKKPSFGLFCFNRPLRSPAWPVTGLLQPILQLTQLLLFLCRLHLQVKRDPPFSVRSNFVVYIPVCFIFTPVSLWIYLPVIAIYA